MCIKLSSFWWYFFNIWPFIYWTLNKPSLETWTCVCCYCAYGLFLCFRSLWNTSWKRQEIWGGSRTVRCRSQWVNLFFFPNRVEMLLKNFFALLKLDRNLVTTKLSGLTDIGKCMLDWSSESVIKSKVDLKKHIVMQNKEMINICITLSNDHISGWHVSAWILRRFPSLSLHFPHDERLITGPVHLDQGCW